MARLLIKGGHIVCPKSKIDYAADILIENGIIKEISENIIGDCETINAEGLSVFPGLVDIHVHLREPGQTHKEDFETGAKAAAKGGFTTICPMPNTNPSIDSAELIKFTMERSQDIGLCNILPIGAITKGLLGKELADIEAMAAAGAIAFSDDGYTVRNSKTLLDALKLCKGLSLPIFSHCEDMDLDENGFMPKISENLIIARDILLAEEANARLHICHISSKGGVQLLKEAKARGVFVTGEAAPHHFTLTDADIPVINGERDANFKMNPPLRDEEDKNALIQAIKDGIIDIIATDHAPHHKDEKAKGYNNAPNGITGLETSFALSYTELVKKNILTLSELIAKMSAMPAEVININAGSLEIGKPADIAIFELDKPYKIGGNFHSKAENSPFIGREVYGETKYTILNGKIVYRG